MGILKRSGLIWALLLCLVLVNGFMAAPSTAHAEHHHGSHQAGSHATGICAWFCAEDQGIETSSIQAASKLQPIEYAEVPRFNEVHDTISLYAFLRGPPPVST